MAQTNLATSVQRLSSGLRINTAKDDAAGLGMVASIQAVRNMTSQYVGNAQNSISMVQTAEGALDVVSKVLQRVLTLTTQKIDSSLSELQRNSLNTEIASLLNQITNIADRTVFQGGQGSIFGTTNSLFTGDGVTTDISIKPLSLGSDGEIMVSGSLSLVDTWYDLQYPNHGLVKGDAVTYHVIEGSNPIPNLVDGQTYYVISELDDDHLFFMLADTKQKALDAPIVENRDMAKQLVDGGIAIALIAPSIAQGAVEGVIFNPEDFTAGVGSEDNGGTAASWVVDAAFDIQAGQSVTRLVDNLDGDNPYSYYGGMDGENITVAVVTDNGDGTKTLVFAPDSSGSFEDANRLIDDPGTTYGFVNAGSATFTKGASGIGIVADADTSTEDAHAAGKIAYDDYFDGAVIGLTANSVEFLSTGVISDAIETNSSNRSELGILFNRLNYTIDNLQTLSNNLSNATSRILDTDYAAETAGLTRSQILQQAATSMLAQANQMPNVVLTLLK